MVQPAELTPLAVCVAPPCLQVSTLPPDMAGKAKARAWMSKLHGMPASYELSEDEVRQLLFDLESSYNEFMANLPR